MLLTVSLFIFIVLMSLTRNAFVLIFKDLLLQTMKVLINLDRV